MIGGEGGIRTHGSVNATPDFESGTFDHSATSPVGAHSTSNPRFGAECSHAEPDSMFANITGQLMPVAGGLRSTDSAMECRQAGGGGSGNRAMA